MSIPRYFDFGTVPIRFGPGSLASAGTVVHELGGRRVLVITDPRVAGTRILARLRSSLRDANVEHVVFDGVAVEPTDVSVQEALAFAAKSDWDVLIGLGGGSSIDSAKAVRAIDDPAADLVDYVLPPIGVGRSPEGERRPLVAVATTAGSGAEVTSNCALTLKGQDRKAVIRHPALRPDAVILDPSTLQTAPKQVLASAGVDALSRALEACTHPPFGRKPSASSAGATSGSTPFSDALALHALRLLGASFTALVAEPRDAGAAADVMAASVMSALASTAAGAHLPHACAYPVAGRVRGYHHPGYPPGVLVPHGVAVGVTLAAAMRFTSHSAGARHRAAAAALGRHGGEDDDTPLVPVLDEMLAAVGVPTRLTHLGYTEADVPVLAREAAAHPRLLEGCPRPVTVDDLEAVFRASL